MQQRKQSFLHGAFILVAATALVKIIGAIFKIPITNILTPTGYGYYNSVYSVYLPIYVLAVAGLPVAVARLVAAENTLGHFRDIKKILHITQLFFLITGTLGSAIMFFGADFLATTPNAVLAMKCMAPTLFLVCMMSAFRGYYEGLRNMYPTAFSQVIEAVGKLAFGLILANAAFRYGEMQFAAGGLVFGQAAKTAEEAFELSLPFAAAGAISGVTIGAFFGLIFLLIRHRTAGDGIGAEELRLAPEAATSKVLFKRLLAISIPIAIGAVALNISPTIDNYTIKSGLEAVIASDKITMQSIFSSVINTTTGGINTTLTKLPNYLWGVFSMSQTLYNLIPMITINFGISALPAVTHAWTAGNKELLQSNIERALRITALISFPSGIGLCVLANPILTLLYQSSNDPIALNIAAPLLQILGLTLVFSAICGPMSSMLQGMGRSDLPVKFVFGGIALKLITNVILIRIPEINIVGAAVGTFICYAFVFIGELYMVLKLSGVTLRVRQTFIKPLLSAAFCGVAAAASYALCSNVLQMGKSISTVISILAAGIIYIFSLFTLRTVEKDDILSFPNGKKLASLLEKLKLIG